MHPHDPLTALLTTNPIQILLLDGALATELESRGCDLNHALWSAKTLIEQPQLIQQVHLDYFNAGADVAITASYQATPLGLLSLGYDDVKSAELIRESVRLAQRARDDAVSIDSTRKGRLLVAGSVGPYGAYLADGSEYRGDYHLPQKEMMDFHRLRVKTLVEAGVDVLAFETIPSLEETQALVSLFKEFPESVAWFSFTVRDEARLADGTELADVCALLRGVAQVCAVGVNCVRRDVVTGALKSLKGCGKPLLAYPNSGEIWDAKTKTWSGEGGEDISLEEYVLQWKAVGARLIGGCCKTGPKDIEVIRRTLDRDTEV